MTYGIVRDMSGDIVVESELEKGSIFTVLLPVADQIPLNLEKKL
jgi:signal transduction histidine kinase